MGKSTGKKGSVSSSLKKDAKYKFHLKDFVFAKTLTHPPWPARISKLQGEYIYKVDFFGVKYWADIQESDLEPFNHKTANLYLKRNQDNNRLIKSITDAMARYQQALKKAQNGEKNSSNNEGSRSLKSNNKTKKIKKAKKGGVKQQRFGSQDDINSSQNVQQIQQEQSNEPQLQRGSKSYSHPPSFFKNKQKSGKSIIKNKNLQPKTQNKKAQQIKEQQSSYFDDEESEQSKIKKPDIIYEEDDEKKTNEKKVKIEESKEILALKKGKRKMNIDSSLEEGQSEEKQQVQVKKSQKEISKSLQGPISKKQLAEKVAKLKQESPIIEEEESKIENEPEKKNQRQKQTQINNQQNPTKNIGKLKQSKPSATAINRIVISPKTKPVKEFSETKAIIIKKVSPTISGKKQESCELNLKPHIKISKAPLRAAQQSKSPSLKGSESARYSESSDVGQSSPKVSETIAARHALLSQHCEHQSFSWSSEEDHHGLKPSKECMQIVKTQLIQRNIKKEPHQIVIDNYRKTKQKSSRLRISQNLIRLEVQIRPYSLQYYQEYYELNRVFSSKLIDRATLDQLIKSNKSNQSQHSSNKSSLAFSSPKLSEQLIRTPVSNNAKYSQRNQSQNNNQSRQFYSLEEGQMVFQKQSAQNSQLMDLESQKSPKSSVNNKQYPNSYQSPSKLSICRQDQKINSPQGQRIEIQQSISQKTPKSSANHKKSKQDAIIEERQNEEENSEDSDVSSASENSQLEQGSEVQIIKGPSLDFTLRPLFKYYHAKYEAWIESQSSQSKSRSNSSNSLQKILFYLERSSEESSELVSLSDKSSDTQKFISNQMNEDDLNGLNQHFYSLISNTKPKDINQIVMPLSKDCLRMQDTWKRLHITKMKGIIGQIEIYNNVQLLKNDPLRQKANLKKAKKQLQEGSIYDVLVRDSDSHDEDAIILKEQNELKQKIRSYRKFRFLKPTHSCRSQSPWEGQEMYKKRQVEKYKDKSVDELLKQVTHHISNFHELVQREYISSVSSFTGKLSNEKTKPISFQVHLEGQQNQEENMNRSYFILYCELIPLRKIIETNLIKKITELIALYVKTTSHGRRITLSLIVEGKKDVTKLTKQDWVKLQTKKSEFFSYETIENFYGILITFKCYIRQVYEKYLKLKTQQTQVMSMKEQPSYIEKACQEKGFFEMMEKHEDKIAEQLRQIDRLRGIWGQESPVYGWEDDHQQYTTSHNQDLQPIVEE